MIDITIEREDVTSSPDRSAFLKGVVFHSINANTWYGTVLPYLANCNFVVASTTDVTYLGEILASPALPDLRDAVTKLELPKFYWFSGIGSNRLHSPFMQLTRALANLQELTITIHPAGLTNHRWAEREMVAMERTDPEAAKERILLPVAEVVRFYEFEALFACAHLLHLHLKYIESPIVEYFCKTGHPVGVFNALKTHLEQGFTRNHMRVRVTAEIVTGQIEEEVY